MIVPTIEGLSLFPLKITCRLELLIWSEYSKGGVLGSCDPLVFRKGDLFLFQGPKFYPFQLPVWVVDIMLVNVFFSFLHPIPIPRYPGQGGCLVRSGPKSLEVVPGKLVLCLWGLGVEGVHSLEFSCSEIERLQVISFVFR